MKGWKWGLIPLVSALGRQNRRISEFKVSLVCIGKSRTVRAI